MVAVNQVVVSSDTTPTAVVDASLATAALVCVIVGNREVFLGDVSAGQNGFPTVPSASQDFVVNAGDVLYGVVPTGGLPATLIILVSQPN